MNEFGDMSDDEASHKLYGHTTDEDDDYDDEEAATFMPSPIATLPASVNWLNEGAVTPVKNQRNCSSCYAFAAIAAVESRTFLKTGRLVPLSEQNLIDCSGKYGNSGCQGGQTRKAYVYIEGNKGIDTEKSYPYQAKNGNCRYQAKYSSATIRGYMTIQRTEAALQQAVANSPVAVAVDAKGKGFRFYKSGVYYNNHCSSKRLGHAMLVVGYGTLRTQGQYWLVKNSWGDKWGQRGYIRMARNRDNNCGIVTRATIPLV
ncbi:procathepsin L-like isoform X2 [Pectinophora gossypiella]|nr:procathepsin L-like isoform X2 [Pectinophora gossypiella]